MQARQEAFLASQRARDDYIRDMWQRDRAFGRSPAKKPRLAPGVMDEGGPAVLLGDAVDEDEDAAVDGAGETFQVRVGIL